MTDSLSTLKKEIFPNKPGSKCVMQNNRRKKNGSESLVLKSINLFCLKLIYFETNNFHEPPFSGDSKNWLVSPKIRDWKVQEFFKLSEKQLL